MTTTASRFLRFLSTVSSACVLPASVAQAAETVSADAVGREASLVLAASLIALGLILRRRVQAGMWASRERAFTRRTQRAERRFRRKRLSDRE